LLISRQVRSDQQELDEFLDDDASEQSQAVSGSTPSTLALPAANQVQIIRRPEWEEHVVWDNGLGREPIRRIIYHGVLSSDSSSLSTAQTSMSDFLSDDDGVIGEQDFTPVHDEHSMIWNRNGTARRARIVRENENGDG